MEKNGFDSLLTWFILYWPGHQSKLHIDNLGAIIIIIVITLKIGENTFNLQWLGPCSKLYLALWHLLTWPKYKLPNFISLLHSVQNKTTLSRRKGKINKPIQFLARSWIRFKFASCMRRNILALLVMVVVSLEGNSFHTFFMEDSGMYRITYEIISRNNCSVAMTGNSWGIAQLGKMSSYTIFNINHVGKLVSTAGRPATFQGPYVAASSSSYAAAAAASIRHAQWREFLFLRVAPAAVATVPPAEAHPCRGAGGGG